MGEQGPADRHALLFAAGKVARAAIEQIAETEGADAAADYLAAIVQELYESGGQSHMGSIAHRGIEYAGERRDVAWAVLKSAAIVESETRDPDGLGIPLDAEARQEIVRICDRPTRATAAASRLSSMVRDMLGLPAWVRTDAAGQTVECRPT